MYKEMPVMPVDTEVDMKRTIGKNGGLRRRRGTKGHVPPPKKNVTCTQYHNKIYKYLYKRVK
jgi:hypothetical protein